MGMNVDRTPELRRETMGKTAVSAALLFLVLWGVGWWLNRTISIFVSDTGLRFIQIRELIANGWQTLAVSYPGRVFDPDLIHVPYYYAYSLVDGEIFLNISPFMPWLASWGYAALGVAGMMLVPALGGALTAVGVYRLAQLSQLPRPRLVMWLAIFATPMFFYSIELWDHTLATAAAAWSVYWLARGVRDGRRRDLLLAGMVMGLGLNQRPEMYLFALCAGAATLLATGGAWRLLLPVVAGGVVTAVPLWWWQYAQVGHPLGMALATNLFGYGAPPVLGVLPANHPWFIRLSRKLFVVEARDALTFLAALLVSAGLVLTIVFVRVEKWHKPILWRAGAAVLLAGYALVLIKVVEPYLMSGVLATFPLAAIAALYCERTAVGQPDRVVYKLIFATAFLFFISMTLIWPAYGGLQWSWRYLLPFFPLAVYLAFYNTHALLQRWGDWRRNEVRCFMVVLAAATVALQAGGFYAQVLRHEENGMVRDGVAALPVEVIISNGALLPAEAATLEDKTFLTVRSESDLEAVILRLWAQGVTQFAIVPLHFVPLPPPQVGGVAVREIRPFVFELSGPRVGEEIE